MPDNKSNTATFNVKLIHALLQLVQHQGISTSSALAQSPIEKSHIDIPGRRYSIAVFEELLHFLTLTTNNKKLAILAAEATQPRMLGSVGFVMTTANTLHDAYQMLGDYFSLIYEGLKLTLEHDKDNCIINLKLDTEDPMVTEFFISCLLNWPRWLTGRTIPAKTINFKFDAIKDAIYHHQLATQVNFSQTDNQLIFSNHYMNFSCSEANAEMHLLHCNFADSLIYKSSQKLAIIAQTKHQIRHLLQVPQGRETIGVRRDQVAQNLNMSLRTFQRKLTALDSNFQNIHDSVRQEICLQLIAKPEMNFGQIAYKLGFSNLSAFQKAFKRWMQISPSEYRKKLSSNDFIDQANIKQPRQKPQWHLALSSSDLEIDISQRIANISGFSLQLLCTVALIQSVSNKTVSVDTLMQITGNSIARLSIYLWPAQQQELIADIETPDTEAIQVEFTSEAVVTKIIAVTNARLKTELHYKIACHYQQKTLFQSALNHFFLCDVKLLEHEQINLLFKFCEDQVSTLINQRLLLNNIYKLMIKCQLQMAGREQILNDLYIAQFTTWIALAYFDAAQQKYHELNKTKLSQDQQVTLAIGAAQLFIEINRTDKALKLLLNTAEVNCHLPKIGSRLNNFLQGISEQLEIFASFNTQAKNDFLNPEQTSPLSNYNANQLRILQKIITTCLHDKQPIMAAYATAKMFSLSLKHTDYLYSSSACAYFSWVCSTFTGQIEMVKLCTQRALLLASKHSENQLIKCKLILSYKVHHWLYPLSELKTNLQQEINKIDPANKRYLSIDILLQHLRLCSGSPINTIHQHCNELLNTVTLAPSNLATMAIANLRDTTSRLANKKSDVSNEYVNYQNSMSAFGRLFASFYNFEQRLWPYMQHWDSIIESEISGDFIVTEAVFICTLMRIHCLESNIGKARLRLEKNRLEAYINRLKSWAELCPENFSSQYALANTVFHAKFGSEQSAIDKFEAIIGTLNRCSFLHHKILYYHYYAQVLSLNHPTLAALCLDKKHRLHAQWLNKSKN